MKKSKLCLDKDPLRVTIKLLVGVVIDYPIQKRYVRMETGNEGDKDMLTKLTSRNQITIPKKIIDQLPDVNYFDLELKEGIITLKPLRIYNTHLEQIRAKIKALGLKQDSIAEAIRWARSK